MASLIASHNTFMSQLTRPSTPLSTLRMPHVFVIPPEEERQDNPPFCCFDADEQPENSNDFASNIHSIDDPHLFQHSENDMPTRIVGGTHARVYRPRLRASVSKKLEKRQHPEVIKIIETKSTRVGQRDIREDSDVVEVVKVKRVREAFTDPEENTKAKRSKTLKARASEALRSIKNVGKTSSRIHVKDLWASTESMSRTLNGMEGCPPPSLPKNPLGSLSRASSLSLAQIFQPMKPSRSESEFTVRVPSPVASTRTHHAPLAANPQSLPHSRYNHANSPQNEAPSIPTTNDAHMSPVPPTKKTPTTKFSVRELHRLFSLSAPSPVYPSPLHTTGVIPFSPAGGDSKPSISPDVAMEDDLFADAQFVDLDSPDRTLASRYHQASPIPQDDLSDRSRLSNSSFEMKLDSLHFDALSFDAEDFHVSREGSIPR